MTVRTIQHGAIYRALVDAGLPLNPRDDPRGRACVVTHDVIVASANRTLSTEARLDIRYAYYSGAAVDHIMTVHAVSWDTIKRIVSDHKMQERRAA